MVHLLLSWGREPTAASIELRRSLEYVPSSHKGVTVVLTTQYPKKPSSCATGSQSSTVAVIANERHRPDRKAQEKSVRDLRP